MDSCAEQLLEILHARGETLATCESLTAGLAASSLADIPGASAVLLGGLITYATSVKAHFTHVPLERLETEGVVSKYTALKMAQTACIETGSHWGVSFTGVAGPGLQEGKPAGTVYVGVCSPSYGVAEAVSLHGLRGGRNEIRAGSVERGFAEVIELVKRNTRCREQ